MNKATELSFKISSALKTILGKELITDNHIAIFELVKNSFDANARRVDVTIDGFESGNEKILVQDDGDGMSKSDIDSKWLFVAYSAKKDLEDYRNRAKTGRAFAGAKGIGRFSCDRLGSKLRIYTKTNKDHTGFHSLEVDWGQFEEDQSQEFQTIKATYTKLPKIPYKLEQGTILEITNLRGDRWNRNELISLRRKLERLVNPNPPKGKNNFFIYLNAPSERKNDKTEAHDYNKVNGRIENTIFEKLKTKTTQLISRINEGGETITTQLLDRGVKIFEIEERNPFKDRDGPILHDVSVHLYHMNRSARNTFTRHMGIQIQEYGSIFLYKNSFRIHPFGNPGDDMLGISERQTQGMFRRLGTRDVAGRIEIFGDNPDLKETSSRDGGLIQTATYDALKKYLVEFALKRLEKYIIEFAKFGIQNVEGYEKGYIPDLDRITDPEFQDFLIKWTKSLTNSKDVIRFDYDPEVIDILKSREASSTRGIIKNFERIASEQNDEKLVIEAQEASKHLTHLIKAKSKAEEEAEAWEEIAEIEADKAEAESKNRKQIEKQNLFLTSVLSRSEQSLVGNHLIKQEIAIIINHAEGLINAFNKSDLNIPDRWKERLSNLIISARKSETLSMFSTHANFSADSDSVKGDLIAYIEEYISNVLENKSPEYEGGKRIPISFSNKKEASFETIFTPIRLTIILDNLINNSAKHAANKIEISIKTSEDAEELTIDYIDDGLGIKEGNKHKIFEAGFTTTKGSGLGLYHVKKLTNEIKGKITVNTDATTGAHFTIKIPK